MCARDVMGSDVPLCANANMLVEVDTSRWWIRS